MVTNGWVSSAVVCVCMYVCKTFCSKLFFEICFKNLAQNCLQLKSILMVKNAKTDLKKINKIPYPFLFFVILNFSYEREIIQEL